MGFVGAGNMGGAILKGWIAAGIAVPERLAACVRSPTCADEWREAGLSVVRLACVDTQLNGRPRSLNPPLSQFPDALQAGAEQCAEFSDIIFLGVKPQFLAPVLAALAPHVTKKHTVVSIAAGWTIAQLEEALPEGTAVVRVMPNTPILVGQGASGYCVGRHASHEDVVTVHALLEACGLALRIDESQMDALTAVSGSGPAYMFMMLDAMADGGVAAGLPRDKALALAAQTMRGAADMVLGSGGAMQHPGVLKDRVGMGCLRG